MGTTTTSSWLGMNVARSILYRAPAGQVAALQRQGRMNAVASVPPFAGPRGLLAPLRHGRCPIPSRRSARSTRRTGPPTSTIRSTSTCRRSTCTTTSCGSGPIPTSTPTTSSTRSGCGSSAPTRTSPTRSTGRPPAPMPAPTTGCVEWQPTQDPAPGFVVFARGWHRPAWLSGQALAVYALALVGAPVLAWRRRRSDPALAGTLAVLWWTTAYACHDVLTRRDRGERALPVRTRPGADRPGRRGGHRRGACGLVEVAAEGAGGHHLRRCGHHPDRARIVPPSGPGGRAGGREVLGLARLLALGRPIGGRRGVQRRTSSDGCRLGGRDEWGAIPRRGVGRVRVRLGVGPSPGVRRRRSHQVLPTSAAWRVRRRRTVHRSIGRIARHLKRFPELARDQGRCGSGRAGTGPDVESELGDRRAGRGPAATRRPAWRCGRRRPTGR